MKRYFLNNGLTVIEKKRNSDSVTIQMTVKTGSNYEREGIRGISHFIEHMLFEGTENRKNAREISNEIESFGGEINAYTNNVRTGFYVKVPKKHFEKAVEIISDIIKNPLFKQKDIDKERQVILKEINIFNDECRFFQWILFQKALFKKHPARYPAYGTRENVNKIGRKQILDYFNKYYTASNAILSVVGGAENSRAIIEKYFNDFRGGEKISNPKFADGGLNKVERKQIKRKTMNSYMVLGFKTVPRINKDAYILDVIQAILGRGQSGVMFDEIRSKRGLAYEVGVHHEASTDFGFFAVYLSADKKNLAMIESLILKTLTELKQIDSKSLKEAIGFVEGRYILDAEDTHTDADNIGFWELIKDARLEDSYLKWIRQVSQDDIRNVVEKYFKNYALALIQQE